MIAAGKTRRPLVIASVMAAMFMVAIEATIVSTAMPQIAAQLGGLDLYAWVFSSFLLAQTATTVVFGKLSDTYGRKPVLLAGIAVFLVGSALCGFAWSLPSLIAFRLVQGIGAGAVQPVAMTVVGDLYTAEERGRVQGFLAGVWAVSALVGPLAGGLIVQHLAWAWVFWINLPVGALAFAGFTNFLHEAGARERRPVDVLGAILFALLVAALMVALSASGDPRTALPALTGLALAAGLFVLQQRRSAEPMIAAGLWGRRPIAAANGASLLAGMALVGLTTFLPIYVQGVMGRSALVAGFALTMSVVGWPLGATLSARSFGRFGLRPVMRAGGALMPVGALAFVWLTPEASPALAGAGSFVMGFGMGLVSTAAIVLVQEIVAWRERGSATASNIFSRNLGSTLGAAALGAVLGHALARPDGTAVTSEQLRRLIEAPGGASAPDAATRALLHHGLHLTFWAVLALSLLVTLLAALVPPVALGRGRDDVAE